MIRSHAPIRSSASNSRCSGADGAGCVSKSASRPSGRYSDQRTGSEAPGRSSTRASITSSGGATAGGGGHSGGRVSNTCSIVYGCQPLRNPQIALPAPGPSIPGLVALEDHLRVGWLLLKSRELPPGQQLLHLGDLLPLSVDDLLGQSSSLGVVAVAELLLSHRYRPLMMGDHHL